MLVCRLFSFNASSRGRLLPRVQVTHKPMPLLPHEAAVKVRKDSGSLMTVLCVTLAGAVLTASFAATLVRSVLACRCYSSVTRDT